MDWKGKGLMLEALRAFQTFHPLHSEGSVSEGGGCRWLAGGGKVGVSPFKKNWEQNRKASPCFGSGRYKCLEFRGGFSCCVRVRSGQSTHTNTNTATHPFTRRTENVWHASIRRGTTPPLHSLDVMRRDLRLD